MESWYILTVLFKMEFKDDEPVVPNSVNYRFGQKQWVFYDWGLAKTRLIISCFCKA